MAKSNNESVTFNGVVLWFNSSKGYGFIKSDEVNSGKGIYVHFSHIMGNENFKTLSMGQLVTFEITETEKGLMCINVKPTQVKKIKSLESK